MRLLPLPGVRLITLLLPVRLLSAGNSAGSSTCPAACLFACLPLFLSSRLLQPVSGRGSLRHRRSRRGAGGPAGSARHLRQRRWVVNATLVHAMRRLAACLVRITGFLLCLPIKISRRRACP